METVKRTTLDRDHQKGLSAGRRIRFLFSLRRVPIGPFGRRPEWRFRLVVGDALMFCAEVAHDKAIPSVIATQLDRVRVLNATGCELMGSALAGEIIRMRPGFGE